jgi:hypothetical protein
VDTEITTPTNRLLKTAYLSLTVQKVANMTQLDLQAQTHMSQMATTATSAANASCSVVSTPGTQNEPYYLYGLDVLHAD